MSPHWRPAAIVVLAIGLVGCSSTTLPQSPSAAATLVPTATATSSSTPPPVPTANDGMDTNTATWTQFTASRYGYTVAWPDTAVWIHSPATEDWAGQTAQDMWASSTDAPWVDKFYDQTTGLTMTAVAATMPVGSTEEAFIDAYLKPDGSAPPACPESAATMKPIMIDGHAARETTSCDEQAAFVAVGRRMYVFSISGQNEVAFLDAYLSTVRLPVDTTSWVPFTSTFYGFTVSHPADWSVMSGSGHWSLANYADATEDILTSPSGPPSPVRPPNFSAIEVKVPSGMTADAFVQAITNLGHGSQDCYPLGTQLPLTTIDGHPATIADGGCVQQYYYAEATAVIGNRVWIFNLHGPNRSLIGSFLSTVKIDATKVVD